MEFAISLYELFGLDYRLELSTRPEERVGDDAIWDRAEARARAALESRGLPYAVNEGDGAFYGPKIDLHLTDSHRPLLAVRHGAARLQPARAVRPHLHRRRRPRAPAGDDPPRDARRVRALHRHPDRALRRRVPALARAGAGARAADRRPPRRLRARRRRRVRGRRPARRAPTCAASRSARRSPRRRPARCPSCSSSATARRRAGRSPLRRHGRRDLGARTLDEAVAELAPRSPSGAERLGDCRSRGHSADASARQQARPCPHRSPFAVRFAHARRGIQGVTALRDGWLCSVTSPHVRRPRSSAHLSTEHRP